MRVYAASSIIAFLAYVGSRLFGTSLLNPLLSQDTTPASVITGQPYSGNATLVRTPLAADGNRPPQPTSLSFYRDSQGRTRTEEWSNIVDPWSGAGQSTTVRIVDPVAGVGYYLDNATQTGVKTALRWDPAIPKSAHPSTLPYQAATSAGVQIFLGLPCTVTGTSRSIRSGEFGNAPSMTILSEQWYSEDLSLVIKSSFSDPIRGTIAFAFQSISRNAPDPALFTPPSTFTITDAEAGDVPGRAF